LKGWKLDSGFDVGASDTKSGYGWISIALHWITAVTVVAMLTIGIMSQGATIDVHARLVHLHTSIGLTVYALLWGRIVWRFVVGHPGPLPRQGRFFFAIGKYFHFTLLPAIAVMVVSGPLMAWVGGRLDRSDNYLVGPCRNRCGPLRSGVQGSRGKFLGKSKRVPELEF
jgi:cytochrome b561